MAIKRRWPPPKKAPNPHPHQVPSHNLNHCWPRYLTPNVVTRPQWVNSLVPGRSGFDFKNANSYLVLLILLFRSSHGNDPRWMSWDYKSTLVQVMAWCCQATSHYPSQCWHIFMLPYGITRHNELPMKHYEILCNLININIFWKHFISENVLKNLNKWRERQSSQRTCWGWGCFMASVAIKEFNFFAPVILTY